MLATQLEQRLRISGAIPLIPYTSLWREQGQLFKINDYFDFVRNVSICFVESVTWNFNASHLQQFVSENYSLLFIQKLIKFISK